MNIKTTAILFGAAAVASQAAGSLWNINSPDYQVQVPCVINGTPSGDNNGDGQTNTYDCAGWWFGYGFGPEGGPVGDYSPKNADGSLITTDPATGEVIANGNLTATGIKLTLSAPAGSADAPTGAGIGFQYNKPEGPVDLSGHTGYCISYTSTAQLQLELGWDEDANGYDTWFALLQPAATATAVDLPWDLSVAASAKASGSWKKDGWATGTGAVAINTAVSQAWSLKLRLKNGTATVKNADVEIQQVGWVGECGTPAALPSLNGMSSIKASLNGRALSFSGLGKAPVSVEIISLQGRVLASETISSAKNTLSLNKLNSGMYIVRANGKDLSFTSKITLK